MFNYVREKIKIKKVDIKNDLSAIVGINSVYDTYTVSKENPYGKGVSKALEWMKQRAISSGFKAKIHNNRVCEIIWGSSSADFIGIFGHLDTVPIGTGWKNDPFLLSEINENYVGRGTQDDKGPVIAAFYALQFLKESGVKPSKPIRLVLGGDEERGSSCMNYYVKKCLGNSRRKKAPQNIFGFTPDACFPAIFSEKASIVVEVKIPTLENSSEKIDYLVGGTAANVVPNQVTTMLNLPLNKELVKNFNNFVDANKLKGTITIEDANRSLLTLTGQSAHGSTPHKGKNAITYLAKFLQTQIPNSKICEMLSLFHNKTDGSGFQNLKHSNKIEGDLTINLGRILYQLDKAELILDIRFPSDVAQNKVLDSLRNEFSKIIPNCEFKITTEHKNLKFDQEDSNVKLLMKCYQEVSGDLTAKPLAIGGGTYAKHIPNCIAYGMLRPKSIETFHQANERLAVSDLYFGIEVYFNALYELSK